MDWLDQYLHELHRPGAVMHFPPDKPSWHAPNPTKQQLSLMQDATVADMVRMRMIQEARQAEIDAGAGGGYDAGSATRERTTVAPAGIPVASTASVIVASVAAPYGESNDTYTKKNNLENFTSWDGYTVRSSGGVCYVSNFKYVLVPPNVSLEYDYFGSWESLGSRNYWSLANLLYDDGSMNWGMGVVSPFYNYAFRNDSTNASFIPQSSYYMYDRDLNITVFSSPLTITAA